MNGPTVPGGEPPLGVSQRVSAQLQGVGRLVATALERAAGRRVDWSLFVWTEGRANYIASADRREVAPVIGSILAGWRRQMPDLPAHEINLTDEASLVLFTERMRFRLSEARREGSGTRWHEQTDGYLALLLRGATARGDTVEAACLCMVLCERAAKAGAG